MAEVAIRKMHADEVPVDDALVRALITAQFPQWAELPIERIPSTGTDNVIFRLGEEFSVRVPRIQRAVRQIRLEHQWLPALAPQLPAAVPEPVALGEPGNGYPYPWSVYRWLGGEDALVAPVADWCGLARDVAGFVTALQLVSPGGAPTAGARGRSLAPHDEHARAAILALDGAFDVERATAIWAAAVAAPGWSGPPVWVHGDLLPGNVLVRDDRLVGIIDWSAAGVGDPACDAMFAWSLPAEARAAYRAELQIDDATWARGRGWTLEQAATFIPYYLETIPAGVAAARRRIEAVLSDGDP